MTPTDLELCRYAATSYTATPTWQREDVRAALFLQADRHTAVVAFPGSEKLGNWFRDLDAWPVWTKHYGICHRGFYRGAMSLAHQIRDDLVGYRIVFCGHSLGGALALITAAEFIALGTPVDIVTTFGAPRPGGRKLARILRGGVHRLRLYRHANDPVPLVPWLPLLYVQPDLLIELPGDVSPIALFNHLIARYVWAVEEWQESGLTIKKQDGLGLH